MNPRVSVLMTAFNRAEFIGEAIESVKSSLYPNWELIITDDGSTDQTVQIVEELVKSDHRIKFFINKNNLGDYPNRNYAASLASGEFLLYCDSDDAIFPDSISYLLELAEQYPERHLFMRSQGKIVESIDPEPALRMHFFQKQFLFYGPGAMFIRKSFFYENGCFPVKYGPANDMYFTLKLVSKAGVVIHPKRTNFYRIHEGQERNNEKRYLIENYRYMRDALNEIYFPFKKKEISWLKKKNNRRFIVNLWCYFRKNKNLLEIFEIWRKAEFSFSKFLSGVFN